MRTIELKYGYGEEVYFIHENQIRTGKVTRVDVKVEDDVEIDYFIKGGELEIWLFEELCFEDRASLIKSL